MWPNRGIDAYCSATRFIVGEILPDDELDSDISEFPVRTSLQIPYELLSRGCWSLVYWFLHWDQQILLVVETKMAGVLDIP